MNNFKRDEETGLWKWPVLLDGDWSRWTKNPCAVLFGHAPKQFHSLKHIASFDLPSRWPQLQQFCLGRSDYLVLAQGYSTEQALLFAEDVNRQLREVQLPQNHYAFSHERGMTWGIAVPEGQSWDMSDALTEAFSLVQNAEADGRVGSINMAEDGWQNNPHDELVVCARRDGLTNLWNWQSLAAMRLDGEPLTLLMGDMDKLKTLNDIYGFPMGDDAISAVAHILHSLQSVDVTIFRLGGDEFMLLARGFSLERAREIADEVNKKLSETTLYFIFKRSNSSFDVDVGHRFFNVRATGNDDRKSGRVVTKRQTFETWLGECSADIIQQKTPREHRGAFFL